MFYDEDNENLSKHIIYSKKDIEKLIINNE